MIILQDKTKEEVELGNDLYGIIYDHIMPFESPGSNAHQKAQSLTEEVLILIREWKMRQAPLEKP